MKKGILTILFIVLFIIGVQAQVTYTFTNAGAEGSNGPTAAQIGSAYTGTTLEGLVTSHPTYQGIQEFIVPATGTYRIQTIGATGGNQNETSIAIGQPANITGEFELTAGTKLYILVGQHGHLGSTRPGWGGGGGSFVVQDEVSSNGTALIIAGGSGSGHTRYTQFAEEQNASVTSTLPVSRYSQPNRYGGNGAGFLVNGDVGNNAVYLPVPGTTTHTIPQAFINGGAGDEFGGGFGGGGGTTNTYGGAGGGYLGGVSANGTPIIASGGSSLNTGINQSNVLNNNNQYTMSHGAVTITELDVTPDITTTPWRMNRGRGAIAFNIGNGSLGNPIAYAQMQIPTTDDGNWGAAPLDNNGDIRFVETSILSSCRAQLDFTYFETYIDIPEGATVDELTVTFAQVDDGARAYIFNSQHPNGAFDGEITINNGVPVSRDYSQFAVAGERNRVVIVQFDSCPVGNNLVGANLNVNGTVVEVNNSAPPVVVAQNFNANLDANGNVVISASDIDNGSFSVLAGPVTLSIDQTAFSCANIGTPVQVTLTATDTNGEMSTATAMVTVVDNIPPTIITKPVTIIIPSEAGLTIDESFVVDTNAGSLTGDNCGAITYGLSKSLFTYADIADSPLAITVTGTDSNGNVTQEQALVTIQDNVDPIAITKDITAQLDENGSVSITPEQVNNGSTDNSGGTLTYSLSQTDFDCDDLTSNNSSLNFNGSSSAFGSIPYNSALTLNSFTVEAWVKTTRSTAYDRVVTKAVGGGQNYSLAVHNGKAHIRFDRVGGGQNFAESAVNVNDGEWHHLAGVHDTNANTIKIYVDGILADTRSTNGDPITGTQSLEIGRFSSSFNQNFLGDVDDIRVWNDVRTDQEVSENYNKNLSGNEAGLVAFLNMNEGTATLASNLAISADASLASGVTRVDGPFELDNAGNVSVTLTVTDPSGNTATATATVSVVDSVLPSVNLNGEAIVNLNENDVFTETAEAVDNCSATLQITGAVDTAIAGVYVLTYKATDASGNESELVTRTVNILDVTPPSVVCAEDVSINTDQGSATAQVQVSAPVCEECGYAANTGTIAWPLRPYNNSTGSGSNAFSTTQDYVFNGPFPTATSDAVLTIVLSGDINNTTSEYVDLRTEDGTLLDTRINSPDGNINRNYTIEAATFNRWAVDGNITFTIVGPPLSRTNVNGGSGSMNLELDTPVTLVNDFNGTADASGTYPLGNTIVTWTATDAAGNQSSCTQTITVLDAEQPVLTVQDVTISTDDNTCDAIVSVFGASATDNSGSAELSFDLAEGTTFNLGTTQVTATAIDAAGNNTSATFNVIVEDNTKPVVITQNLVVNLDASGNTSITASQIDNGSTDNCSIQSVSLDITSFDCSDLGDNTVTLTVTDDNGNSQTGTATVTVNDITPPNVITKDITVALDANGNASIVPSQVDNGSDDNCNIETLLFGVSSDNGGQEIVPVTSGSRSGRSLTGINYSYAGETRTLTPANAIASRLVLSTLTAGSGDANRFWDANSTTGMTEDKALGVLGDFDLGTVLQDCGDPAGVKHDVMFDTPITPGAGPEIFIVHGGLTQNIQILDTNGDVVKTLNINVNSSSSSVTIGGSAVASRFFGFYLRNNTNFQVQQIGTHGNSQNRVLALDLNASEVSEIGGIRFGGGGCNYTYEILGFQPEVGTAPQLDFTCDNLGANTVTLQATDASGNVSTETAIVTIEDNIVPTITLNGAPRVFHNAYTAYVDLGATANDNCSAVITSLDNLDTDVPGSYSVTHTATDASGNSVSISRTVIVRDITSPKITTQSTVASLNAGGNASISLQNVITSTSDDSDVVNTAISNTEFDCDDLGDNTVLASAEDINGNSLAIPQNGLIGYWKFGGANPLVDLTGNWGDIEFVGNASVNDGTLEVNTNGFARTTGYAGQTITSKTLISYVSLDNIDIRTGSAMSIDGVTNDNFDAIVYAERQARRWMNGSTSFRRTQDLNPGFAETEANQLVQMAITYEVVGGVVNILVFRNGVQIGAYSDADDTAWAPNNVEILFGARHSIGNVQVGGIDARISKALLYDRALSVEEIQAMNGTSVAVSVVDEILPEITAPADISVFATSAAGATVNYVTPIGTDNCSVTTALIAGLADGATFPIGTTVVTYTATDASGNSASASFNVEVAGLAPEIIVPTNITVDTDAGVCGAIVNYSATETTAIPASVITYDIQPGSSFAVGTVTVTATATNPVGSSVKTFTLTVEDNEAPTAITQPLTVQLDADGNGSITAEAVNNGSSDACGIASLSLDNSTFTCDNVGVNTVTLTVTDNNGNVSTAEATITVVDSVAPVAIAQSLTVQLDADGNGSITAEAVNNGSSDACGIASLSLDNSTFTCDNVGVNTVTLTVTDNNGNVSTAEATITVVDSVAPVALANDISINLKGNGTASITADMIDAGSSDACGITSVTLDILAFDCANVGVENIVTLTVIDVNGNESTATANVTVNDVTAPRIRPENITASLDENGQFSLDANNILETKDSRKGDRQATAAVKQALKRLVRERKIEQKALAILAKANANLNVQQSLVNLAQSQLSNASTALSVAEQAYTDAQATGNNQLIKSALRAIKSAKRSVTITSRRLRSATAQLVKRENKVLVATRNEQRAAQAAFAANFKYQQAVAQQTALGEIIYLGFTNDACGIASIEASQLNFDCSNVGENEVTLTVTDIHGNVRTDVAIVTIIDVIAPTVVTQDITVALDENGEYSISASDIDGGSFDNCSFDLSIDNNAFNCSTLGENIVNLTATDASGNVTTLPATVTVKDNAAPTIVATSIEVQLDENGSASITVSDVDGGTYDNCAVASVTIDMDSFTCDNLGDNIVTITATDVNGNVSSGPAVVTVVDVIAPTVGVQNISIDLDVNGNATITPEDVLILSEDDIETGEDCTVSAAESHAVWLSDYVQSDNTGEITGINNTVNNSGAGSSNLSKSWSDYYKKKKGGDKDKKKGDDDDDDDDDKDDDDDDKGKKVKAKDTRFVFDPAGGGIHRELDGTAVVTGTIVSNTDPSDQWIVTLNLANASNWADWSAMGRSYKDEKRLAGSNYRDWTYYEMAEGSKLTGAGRNAGEVISLTHAPTNYRYGFQLGDAANSKNANFGMSGWFFYTNRAGKQVQGDFNLDVTDCQSSPAPADAVITSDNCSIASTSLSVSNFDCTNLGDNTVQVTVTDQSGNATTKSAVVTINDRIAPTILTQDITVSLGANGSVTVDPSLLDGGSTDNTNCLLTFTLDRDTFDCGDITKDHSNGKGKGHNYGDDDDDNDPGKGNGYGHKKNRGHKVTLTVTDAAGNSSSARAYITVIDDEAPVISSAPITVVVDGRKKAYLSKYDVENAVTDNCKVKYIYFRRMKYDRDDVGMNSVQVTARDYSGNTTTGNVMVNVIDISNYGRYVDMCYNGKTIRVKKSYVQHYLRKGASIGGCVYFAQAGSSRTIKVIEDLGTDGLAVTPDLKLLSYPNPTSGYTVISFSSQVDGAAKVSILNTNGVEMDKLFDDELVAQQEVEVGYEAGKLPSGIYIVRMVTAGEVKTIKLVVRK